MPERRVRYDFDGRRVLVVEDEYLAADALRRELEAAGADVVGPAPGVADALALLESAEVDVAILDVNVGGERVDAVVDALLARRVPIVFATGYDAWAMPEAYAHVPRCEKPVDLHALAGALARAVA